MKKSTSLSSRVSPRGRAEQVKCGGAARADLLRMGSDLGDDLVFAHRSNIDASVENFINLRRLPHSAARGTGAGLRAARRASSSTLMKIMAAPKPKRSGGTWSNSSHAAKATSGTRKNSNGAT